MRLLQELNMKNFEKVKSQKSTTKELYMKEFCNDCKYYLAVDVFKGICKISKDKIFPESKSCKDFAKNAKCKFCKNYENVKDNIGTCMGKTDAYPDMIATTCIDYKLKS